MLQPRNTFVVVSLIEQSERKDGGVIVPTHSDQFCEAIVAAVGPGNVGAAGARSETFDLHAGDRVLVKHQEVRPQGSGLIKLKTGTEYKEGDTKHTIFEQMAIIAIIERAAVGKFSPGKFTPSNN